MTQQYASVEPGQPHTGSLQARQPGKRELHCLFQPKSQGPAHDYHGPESPAPRLQKVGGRYWSRGKKGPTGSQPCLASHSEWLAPSPGSHTRWLRSSSCHYTCGGNHLEPPTSETQRQRELKSHLRRENSSERKGSF